MIKPGGQGLAFDAELVGELVGDGVAVVDADGKFTYLSPRGANIIGMVATDQPVSEWVEHYGVFLPDGSTPYAPDDLPVARALRGESVRDSHMVLRNAALPDGALLSVNAMPLRDAAGEVTGAVAAFRDITAEKSFRTLVERSPDAQLVHRDGSVIYANPRSVALLGYERPNDLVGIPLSDLIHPDDRDTVSRWLAKHGETGASRRTEVRCLLADRTSVPVEGLAQRLVFDGQWSELLTFRDLTDRQDLQRKLLLSERMSSVGTLASGIAHEINNPLAYIIINLEYVRELLRSVAGTSDEKTSTVVRTLGDVQEGAQRIARIVKGLRTVSRSGDEIPEVLDLRHVVTVALRMTESEIKHRARLVTDLQMPPAVLADESQLVQVVVNLLINAAHALPEGSADAHQVTVKTGQTPDGAASFTVRDTGPGIPPTILDRVFEPFFTTKPPGVGTGLGLSICQSVVNRWDGTITVDNDPPNGTAFTIRLPAYSGERRREPEERLDRESAPVGAARVLVIDDDINVGKAFDRVLSRDHIVTVVNSGQEAFAVLEADPNVDIIFCDLMMPTMTGEEFYRRLAKESPHLADRVIFITGALPTSRIRNTDVVRTARVLDKPVDARTLRDAIATRLNDHRR